MPVDPAGMFARLFNPNLPLETAQAIQAGELQGKQSAIQNVVLQNERRKLQQGVTADERQQTGQALLKQAIDSYKANDIKGFQNNLISAQNYVPEEASKLYELLGTVDKTNAVNASLNVLAAAHFNPEDEEAIHTAIGKAIEVVNPNTAMGQELQSLQGMTGVDLQNGITKAVEFATSAGLLPGVTEQQKLELEEKKLKERQKDRDIKLQQLGWDKDKFDAMSKQLDSDQRKHLNTTIEAANSSNVDAQRMGSIRKYVDTNPNLVGGGIYTRLASYAKKLSGVSDEKEAFRAMFNRIKVEQGIKNLPPGVASDKDIELVMGGIPDPEWGKDTVLQWLRGRQKSAIMAREYHKAVSDWYNSGHVDMRGFYEDWDKKSKQVIEQALADEGLELDLTEEGKKLYGKRAISKGGVDEATKAVKDFGSTVEKAVPEMVRTGEKVGEAVEKAAKRVKVKLSDL